MKYESGVNFHVIERVKGGTGPQGQPWTRPSPLKLESEVIMRIKILEESWKPSEGVRTSTENGIGLEAISGAQLTLGQ